MARILIIDDDPVYGDMTTQRLERAGHKVKLHIGPFGASALAVHDSPDLVILDVFMPGLSGPELLGIMRKNAGRPDLPVLLFSSMDPGPLSRLATEHGAVGWVTKSASRDEFLTAVQKALLP